MKPKNLGYSFILLSLLLSLLSPTNRVLAASIIYANENGLMSGTCNNWTNACDLQYAIAISTHGDEVWLMQGTYYPTVGLDRTISFVMKDGVSLYGGFLGTETKRDERSTDASFTILSGNIGLAGDPTDNSYHVVISNGTTNATVLSGFTITAGYANGVAPHSFGAGMYNDGGSPTIYNIIFDSNIVSPTDLENGAGGGIYNINGDPTFTDVIFSNNAVTQISYGGECLGGGIYSNNSNLTMTNVTFLSNQATTTLLGQCGGAGMYSKNSTINLTNITFSNNLGNHMGWPNASLGSAGGGMWNVDSTATLTDVLFYNNTAHFGGAIYNSNSSLTINNADFNNNTGHYYGGGIRNVGGSLIISNALFDGNEAFLGGGGIVNMYATATISLSNITFNKNHAVFGGGFTNLSSIDSNITLTNLTFKDNSAEYAGGGIYLRNGNTSMNHITFHGNTAIESGGALYNSGASPLIQNSIFWGDSSEIFNNGTSEHGASNPTIKDTVISTGCPAGATCTNIITSDPKLGPLSNNGGATQTLALLAGSAAIDAGGENSICTATDQRGVLRPQGSSCDIGSYESIGSYLFNSLLPTSRSVSVGTLATIFHTLVNGGNIPAENVTLMMGNQPAGTFAYYQTDCQTNVVIGSINPILDIPAGGIICYVLMFTPTSSFDATNVDIRAEMNSLPITDVYPGINTWLLRATASVGPDIIALTTTADLHQLACSGTNAFAVALSNVGASASGDIIVSANTGSAILPLNITISETNPATGQIIGDDILENVGANANRTVVVFVNFHGCINFDPAFNRIFIEFRDAANNIVGSTSTAVSTNR